MVGTHKSLLALGTMKSLLSCVCSLVALIRGRERYSENMMMMVKKMMIRKNSDTGNHKITNDNDEMRIILYSHHQNNI